MEFFLNQKSLPIIRKCKNCRFYNERGCCLLITIVNAYDHDKKINLKTNDNFYCDQHKFLNEDFLQKNATVAEYDNVQDAMDTINRAKEKTS